jgi:hypothetical protein
MRRRAVFALLAIAALLLQATMSTHAFKPRAPGGLNECGRGQIAFNVDANAQKDGGDANHARKHWRNECLPCATSAPLPMPAAIAAAIVVTRISPPLIHADNFEARSGVRIDLNAPPTAPPSLS